ncbi:DUF4012 domain-containing protein [Candidatus Gracilibacteria bacterium]|nr:DUF4012 domain-containing protein [Candidatus Gracilibacteria bacterium]
MKFKDIYTSLNTELNLQRFHPKINIEVESFNGSQNKIDLGEDLESTIDATGNQNIQLKSIPNNQKPLDSVFQKKKPLIYISEKSKKRFKLGYIKSKLIYFTDIISTFFNQSKALKYTSIALFILLLIFVDKIIVEYNTNQGYQRLLSIQDTGDNKTIQSKINSAHSNFVIAKILFTPFKLIPSKDVKNASYIIEGGKEITTIAKKNLKLLNDTKSLIVEKKAENIMFSQLLLNNKKSFLTLQSDIVNIENIYEKIEFGSDNYELQSKLELFKEKLKKAKYYSYTFNNNFDTFLEILGHSQRKKYLIAFQNNDEIRANGGFMGSLGLVDIFRGQIKKFEKNDVYFYEFKIKKEQFTKEVAPEGINKMTPYFGLRDANYYINHKDSGDSIKFFMKKAGYPIDGIIYINMTTLSKVFDLVGEFESTTLGQKVNSQNFSTIMSVLVESKVSQKGTTGTPKQVLFDFMKEFQGVLESKNISKSSLVKILYEDLSSRDITLYNFNRAERELMETLSLYNPIDYFSSLDFSYPVFTSISGNKSDRYIKHSYNKIVTKGPECSYYTTLELNNKHTFGNNDLQYISELTSNLDIDTELKEKLLFIQGNGDNKQYVRVIIPKEAVISTKNVDIIDYSDRGQSVNFYMNTPVGETSSFKLEYSIANKECKTYSYKFYKQPGIEQYDININNLGENREFLNNKKDVYIN